MHMQIRVKIPSQSPPSVAKLLGLLAAEGVNLKGAGGSNVEFHGEFAIAVDHDHEDLAFGVLDRNGYEFRTFEVGVNPELRLCHLTDEPGQLLTCVEETEQENLDKNRGIRDILIGVPTDEGIPVQVFSEGNATEQPDV
ncbi:MAG: hypothetical protein H0U52_03380 [Chloroflexi bacterium]|nr:hypothetical protein [Chloroflexota bacterium]